MKVQVLFKGGIITKMKKKKNRVGSFKYFLLMNQSTIKAQIATPRKTIVDRGEALQIFKVFGM
jgi:hypothetical protein